MKNPRIGIVLAFCVLTGGALLAAPEAMLTESASAPQPKSSAVHQSYPATYSAEQISADFALFERAMREAHSGLHVFRTEEEIDAVFAEARRRLAEATSERDLLLAMSWVVAEVQDGHTWAGLSGAAQDFLDSQPTFLPFKLAFIGEDAYLHRDYSPGHPELLGSKVVAINGVPTAQVLAAMVPYLAIDGRSTRRIYHRLSGTTTFGRLYQAVHGPTAVFTLDLELPQDVGSKTVSFDAISYATVEERFNARYSALAERDPFELKVLDDPPATAVMRIDGFFGDGYEDFIDSSFAEIAERGVENLVIDLRANGGGNESFGARLAAYLVTKPFRFYERAVINARSFETQSHSQQPDLLYPPEQVTAAGGVYHLTAERYGFLAETAPRQPHFGGQVYVLIDGGSFSTTTDTCTTLHRDTDAIFIGEEAGGSYYGNTSGNALQFTLPHTKARFGVPLERFYTHASGYEPRDRGLVPDHAVTRSPEDLTGESDAILELALHLIRDGAE